MSSKSHTSLLVEMKLETLCTLVYNLYHKICFTFVFTLCYILVFLIVFTLFEYNSRIMMLLHIYRKQNIFQDMFLPQSHHSQHQT